MNSLLSNIFEKLKSQRLSFTGGIIVVSTSLLNKFVSNTFFKCPSTFHDIYGWSFLVCPALILGLLTLLASEDLSQVATGICQIDNDVPKMAIGGKRKRTWKFIFRNISIALCMAAVAFLSWVILTLITTDVYVCIKLGPVEKAEKKALKEKYEIKSKIAGMILLLVCLMVILAINLARKCYFSDIPEKELPSMRSYDQIEANSAINLYKIEMEKSAEARGMDMVKKFMHIFQMQVSSQECPKTNNTDPMVQREEIEKSRENIMSRSDIENLRYFLALRYPRLDGEEQLVHCRQSVIPENCDLQQVDGMQRKTEASICLLKDKDTSPLDFQYSQRDRMKDDSWSPIPYIRHSSVIAPN